MKRFVLIFLAILPAFCLSQNSLQKNKMDWFDTNYYHTLYKHRDSIEAKKFIDTLVKYLNIKKGLKVLDLACGAGRHSKHLEKSMLITNRILTAIWYQLSRSKLSPMK